MEISDILKRVPALAGREIEVVTFGTFVSITNRTSHVRLATGESYVIRVSGGTTRYLDRAIEGHNAAIAHDLGLAPPILYLDDRFLVTPLIEDARPLAPSDLEREGPLLQVAAMLKRLQSSPVPFKGVRHPFGEIDNYLSWYPHPRAVKLRTAARPIEQSLIRLAPALVPAHVDASGSNFLRTPGGGMLMVDWEFSTMADPYWDVASVLMQRSGEDALAKRFVAAVLGDSTDRIMARVGLFTAALCLVAGSWCAMEAEARKAANAAQVHGPASHDDPLTSRVTQGAQSNTQLSDTAEQYLDRFEALVAYPKMADWLKAV